MLTRTFFARAPLAPNRFAPLPAGAISARGDLRDRLLSLRAGLLSRCESLFPHTGSASSWFGGGLTGGYDAANLLEASLLTAALLGDDELRRSSLRLADAVIDGQREDGSFGDENETFSARGRMLRALCTAYSMTGDKRVLSSYITNVVRGNDNYILYGHHLSSGRMFAALESYESESFFESHRYITFDTIYEEQLFEVMYVFRSRVYNEEDVVFKYYQFIDANSEEEFYSYMNEMADMSFYDTGVTAVYGDTLLTLSTCDYNETNGRFVVVARRIR